MTDDDRTPKLRHVEITDHRLEYYWTREPEAGETVLVFLHEGLGSAKLSRDFPAQLSARTGLPALVYSRYGYSGSDELTRKRKIDYLHREALRRPAAPPLGLMDIIPAGHSDGDRFLDPCGCRKMASARATIMAPHMFRKT